MVLSRNAFASLGLVLAVAVPGASAAQSGQPDVDISRLDGLISQIEAAIESEGDLRLDDPAAEPLASAGDPTGLTTLTPQLEAMTPECLIEVDALGLDGQIETLTQTTTALRDLSAGHEQMVTLLSLKPCDNKALPFVEQMALQLKSVDVLAIQEVLVMTEGCQPLVDDPAAFSAKRQQVLSGLRSYITASRAARQIVGACGL